MLALETPFKEQFIHFKCGEVYYETPENYNVNCSECGMKLSFSQFPQHFQDMHLNPQQDNTHRSNDNIKEVIDVDMVQITRVDEIDSTRNSDGTESSEEEMDEKLPIEFMEVRLPKLRNSTANSFLPEHVTMDFECFEGTANIAHSERVSNGSGDINAAPSQDEMDLVLSQSKKMVFKDECEVEISVDSQILLHDKEILLPQFQEEDSVKTEVQHIAELKEHDHCCTNSSTDEINSEDDSGITKKIEEKLNCKYCQRSYKLKRSLRNHVRIVHEKVSGTSIKNTDKKYKKPADRPTSFICNLCGKSFSCLGNMNTHKKRHSGVKSYKCPECGNYYYTEHEMKKHMLRHTDMLAEICEVCGRGFRNSGKLKAHMRRHTGERPAKCEICGKCFYSQHDLNVHHVTHTTERPFSCEICGSTFRTKKALRVHKKLHIAERPHNCQLCGKAFLQLTGLDSHIRQVHMKGNINI